MAEVKDGVDIRLTHLIINYLKTKYDIKLIDMKTCEASKPGDNYMSVIKRVKVTLRCTKDADRLKLSQTPYFYGYDKTVTKNPDLIFTWILKHQVSNANRNRIFRCREAFVNEIVAYSDIVPVLAGMLADDPQLPMPQVLFCDEKIEEKFLAFEDLFFNGFEMAQRDKGLDLKACSLIVKNLAIFHSASIILKVKDLKTFFRIRESMKEIVYVDESLSGKILESSLNNAIHSLEKRPDKELELIDAIDQLKDYRTKMFKTMKKLTQAVNTSWSVICHGDMWINNFMFKRSKETNEIIDVRLVDLQGIRISNLVIDLLHFIYTSTEREVRDNHLHDLLELYRVNLIHQLNLHIEDTLLMPFFASQFSVENLYEQFKMHCFYGLVATMWFLPAITCSSDNIPNLDNLNIEDFQNDHLVDYSPEYDRRLHDVVCEFYQNGYFSYFPCID